MGGCQIGEARLRRNELHHIDLNFSMADLSLSFVAWSPGTQHMNFSTVPTGPPQQGNMAFTGPGAALPISSSTFSCIACILQVKQVKWTRNSCTKMAGAKMT